MNNPTQPRASGAHVLVLAANTLSHDTRILKQIGSLSDAGYQVSTLALADDALPDHDLTQPGRHIYRFRLNRRYKDPLAGCKGMALGLYAGPIGEILNQYSQAQTDLAMLRKALRLSRVVSGLHWSSKVRKQRRRQHRNLRARIGDIINRSIDSPNRSIDSPNRINLITRYEAMAASFVETSPEWATRVEGLGPPVVVHAHDIYTLAAGAVLADRYGAKLVYDAHEYEPERAPRLPDAGRAMIAAFEDRALRGANALITVSRSILQLYQERHPTLDIRLVMNCPDQRLSASDITGLRERARLDMQVPLVLFVGLPKLDARGLRVTLAALTRLQDAALVIIGPRWPAVDAELMEAVRELGLEDRVHLLDPVGPHDVIVAIRDASVSVCLFQDVSLNHRFAMPNKLFETLLAGVPILVSDFPDMGELVGKHHAGLAVDETDPDAVAAALRTIIADREAFVPKGEARAALEVDSSWQGQEAVLLNLYGTLLPGSDSTLS